MPKMMVAAEHIIFINTMIQDHHTITTTDRFRFGEVTSQIRSFHRFNFDISSENALEPITHLLCVNCFLWWRLEARGSLKTTEEERRRQQQAKAQARRPPNQARKQQATNTSKQCIHPPLGTLVVSTNSSTPLHIEHHVIF